MAHRDKTFLLVAAIMSVFLVGVSGFVSTATPHSRFIFSAKSSSMLFVKKTQVIRPTEVISSKSDESEKEEALTRETPLARATRTLYKPEGIGVSEKEIADIEREIQESTKARLDLKRVEALLEDDLEAEEEASSPDWEVSLAAGCVAGAVALGTTDSLALSALALVSVYLLANGDPLEEQTPAGAAARVVGRATVLAVRSMRPKVKAVARVAIRGEDDQISILMQRIDDLEAENANLRLWQKRRTAVDNALSKYTLAQLKSKVKEHKLPVTGDKTTLLMRLVEAEVIDV